MTTRVMPLLSASVVIPALIATPTLARTLLNRAQPAPEAYSFIDQNDAQAVVRWDGHVVGADPDVNVRFQLMRDGYANEN